MKNSNTELHLPGQNFTGPGTRIVTRILNGVMPTNKTDAITMLHDIDYLSYAGMPRMIDRADTRAILNTPNDLPGVITKFGLTLRQLTQLNFATPLPGLSTHQTREIGQLLYEYVREDPAYQQKFKELKVKL